MDIPANLDDLLQLITDTPRSGLLIATVLAVLCGFIGGMLARRGIGLGRLLSTGSTLALGAILITVVVQMASIDPAGDRLMRSVTTSDTQVEGGETRVPLARDGHFWIEAEVNGARVPFMVDTGATLTAISAGAARDAGLEPRSGGLPIQLNTANGTVDAQLTTIDEVRFGNVAARGLDAVIAPSLGTTNVIGMNLLSQLKGWRVEGNTMILTPNNPQPAVEWGAQQ